MYHLNEFWGSEILSWVKLVKFGLYFTQLLARSRPGNSGSSTKYGSHTQNNTITIISIFEIFQYLSRNMYKSHANDNMLINNWFKGSRSAQ